MHQHVCIQKQEVGQTTCTFWPTCMIVEQIDPPLGSVKQPFSGGLSLEVLAQSAGNMAKSLCVLLAVAGSTAEICTEPSIAPSYYTTSGAVISSEVVFFVEISLTCSKGAQNVALYANVNGKQFPVTRGQDIGRYQVSWSLEHKNAHSGTYEVKFFDEESYSLLRKTQRNNEDISSIKPLFSVNVDHRGAWNGPWVSTDVLAALIAILAYYTACQTIKPFYTNKKVPLSKSQLSRLETWQNNLLAAGQASVHMARLSSNRPSLEDSWADCL